MLHIEGEELAPTLTLVLDRPTWERRDGAAGQAWGRIRIRGLILPTAVTSQLQTENVLEAVGVERMSSALKNGPGEELMRLRSKLKRTIDEALAEIEAEIHSRLVFGERELCLRLVLAQPPLIHHLLHCRHVGGYRGERDGERLGGEVLHVGVR